MKSEVVYNDGDKDKLRIFADNRKKAGVYLWINKSNGNTYVGSSLNLTVRMYSYYSLPFLAKSNRLIDRALLKYGFSSFRLEILEYCSVNELLKKEQHYMDLIKPKYNIVEIAGSNLGYKHSESTLEKMKNFILSDDAKKLKATNVVKYATAANMIAVILENIHTGEKKEYKSLRAAALELGVPNQSLSYCLRKNTLYKKTYIVTKSCRFK